MNQTFANEEALRRQQKRKSSSRSSTRAAMDTNTTTATPERTITDTGNSISSFPPSPSSPLLEGTFDENESHQSFLAALEEWRGSKGAEIRPQSNIIFSLFNALKLSKL